MKTVNEQIKIVKEEEKRRERMYLKTYGDEGKGDLGRLCIP